MLFPLVLLLGSSAKNSNAFPMRHSHSIPTGPLKHDCRIHSGTSNTSLCSTNEDDIEKNSDADLFLLEYSIDSFLRGDYDRAFSEDAASPLPGLSPSDTVDAALRSLRDLDDPEPSHGAAVFLRFCVELGRGERWGTTTSSASAWTELLRGALTPTMLARRIRASEEFSSLLDWTKLEVMEDAGDSAATVYRNGNVARVEAALSFDDETTGKTSFSTEIYRFELAKMLGGVWLIQSVYKESPSARKARQSAENILPPRPTRKKRPNGEGRLPQQRRGKSNRQQERRNSADSEDEDLNDKKKR